MGCPPAIWDLGGACCMCTCSSLHTTMRHQLLSWLKSILHSKIHVGSTPLCSMDCSRCSTPLAPAFSVGEFAMQAHSCVRKACMIAGIRHHVLPSSPEANFALEPLVLERALKADAAAGLLPCYLCVTVGTTSSCAGGSWRLSKKHMIAPRHKNLSSVWRACTFN